MEARRKFDDYVNNGKIKKPDICPKCKKKTKKIDMHGHHFKGYNKKNQLKIKWLCRAYHKEEENKK